MAVLKIRDGCSLHALHCLMGMRPSGSLELQAGRLSRGQMLQVWAFPSLVSCIAGRYDSSQVVFRHKERAGGREREREKKRARDSDGRSGKHQ